MATLEGLTKRLVKLAMEKRLRDELYRAAPEIPDEVRDDIYRMLFRPVMVNFMLSLKKVMENESRSGA
jgi:hypothetical protein